MPTCTGAEEQLAARAWVAARLSVRRDCESQNRAPARFTHGYMSSRWPPPPPHSSKKYTVLLSNTCARSLARRKSSVNFGVLRYLRAAASRHKKKRESVSAWVRGRVGAGGFGVEPRNATANAAFRC